MTEYELLPNGRAMSDPSINPVDQYVAALYWSVMTLTTVGYGDITAKTTGERVLFTISMILGGSCYAYIVGTLTQIIVQGDETFNEFQQRMDTLNDFMASHSLPMELREKLRRYFQHSVNAMRAEANAGLVRHMSPALQGKVTLHIHKRRLDAVPFFSVPLTDENSTLTNNEAISDANERFISALAMKLRFSAHDRDDTIVNQGHVADTMYMVEHGLAASHGRIYLGFSYFGAEMVCETMHYQHSVTALTMLDLYTLSKEALTEVFDENEFPLHHRRVKHFAVRYAMQKFIAEPAKFRVDFEKAQGFARANTNEHAAIQLKRVVQRVGIVSDFLAGNVHLGEATMALDKECFGDVGGDLSRAMENNGEAESRTSPMPSQGGGSTDEERFVRMEKKIDELTEAVAALTAAATRK